MCACSENKQTLFGRRYKPYVAGATQRCCVSKQQDAIRNKEDLPKVDKSWTKYVFVRVRGCPNGIFDPWVRWDGGLGPTKSYSAGNRRVLKRGYLVKARSSRFWHIWEKKTRYYREIDRNFAAVLFNLHKTNMNFIKHHPKSRFGAQVPGRAPFAKLLNEFRRYFQF